jgi:PAS domain S-box-containing protein
MKDEDKSKVQLIDELVSLRQQIAELKTLAAERKRVEEALQESEYKFRSVVEQSHDGIAVVDQQGIIAEWNQAMEQCTGLKAEEVLGRPIWDVQFHMNSEEQRTSQAYEQFKAGLLAFLKTGQAPWANRVLERAYRHPNGTCRIIQGTIYSIKADKGFILVSTARDVTEHRQAEDQIQASLREKEALLREIHHRVKNNLQVICALLDLQAGAVENEQVKTAFQESRNRIRSMAQIHEQLTYAENLAQIDMAAYVQELVTSLRVAHGTNAVLIKIDVSDITLPFDAVSPCGLLINELVANALKHAFPSSSPSAPPVSTGRQAKEESNEIRITLRPLPRDENKMELTVSDNGVGLPSGIDLENSTSLGLTLVKLLTRQLKATLEVKREVGTTFKIVFAP